MPKGTDELADWLLRVINPAEPMPATRPALLGGAAVELKTDSPPPSVRVSCDDGSRFAVIVLKLESSRAEKEEYEREQQRRAEEWREKVRQNPELLEEQRDLGRRMANTFRALHDERHGGSFESCRDDLCDTVRPLITRMTDDASDSESEDDIGLAN